MTTEKTGGLAPSRRTLVKGAAWSVPVVAMASPAMALTCSPNSCPIIFSSGISCRVASDNSLRFVFLTTLPAGTSVTVTSWQWTPNDGATGVTDFAPVTTTSNTPADGQGRLVYDFGIDGNTQGRLYICFSWSGPDVVSDSVCIDTMVNSFENCSGNPSTYPQPSPGAGAGPFVPPTMVWPVPTPAANTVTDDANVEPNAKLNEATVEQPQQNETTVEPPATDVAPPATTNVAPPADDAAATAGPDQ